jgi:hypothetical protein
MKSAGSPPQLSHSAKVSAASSARSEPRAGSNITTLTGFSALPTLGAEASVGSGSDSRVGDGCTVGEGIAVGSPPHALNAVAAMTSAINTMGCNLWRLMAHLY